MQGKLPEVLGSRKLRLAIERTLLGIRICAKLCKVELDTNWYCDQTAFQVAVHCQRETPYPLGMKLIFNFNEKVAKVFI